MADVDKTTDDKTHVRKKRYRISQLFITAMAQHPELLCVISVAIFSLIINYGNSAVQEKTLTVPANSPNRFFPVFSSVFDFPYGSVDILADLIEDDEFLFVMYYAPWCAASIEARWEFQTAANFLRDQVKFVAVNCWWPEGECQQRYKFMEYPAFFLYHTTLDGFRYTGVVKADHLCRFVEDMLYPLDLLHSREEIKTLVARHDTSVIGYFDFNVSPQPPGFEQFYYASMRILEKYAWQPPKFAVITKKSLGNWLQIESLQSLLLVRLGNSSMVFTSEMNYSSTNIVKWIVMNKQQPAVKWLSPPGRKSLMLYSETIRGPALLTFSSYTPLYDYNFHFDMIREVAYSYNNCQNHQVIDEIMQKSYSRRIHSFNQMKRIQIHCKEKHKKDHTESLFFSNSCCKSVISSPPANNPMPTVCEYCLQKHMFSETELNACYNELQLNVGELPVSSSFPVHMCLDTYRYYNVNDHRTLCCKQCPVKTPPDNFLDSYFRTVDRTKTDPFVTRSGEALPKKLCSRQSFHKLSGPQLRDVTTYVSETVIPSNFTGLKCRTNKTLNFYAMDLRRNRVFLEKLGARHHSSGVEPTIVIVDMKNEAQYFLRDDFSTENLAKFITDYTHGNLARSLRSTFTEPDDCNSNIAGVCIHEITSTTWTKVMDDDKDVLLMFYAPWCGFCAGFAHIYIALAKYFKASKKIIFGRIDADGNDLPWEFTVDNYPTLVFFPAHRKSESVVFPANRLKDLPFLIKFVLDNAQSELRFENAISSCTRDCMKRNIQKSYLAVNAFRLQMEKINRRYDRLLILLQRNEDQKLCWKLKMKSSLNTVNQAMIEMREKLKKSSLLHRYLTADDENIFERYEFKKLFFSNQTNSTPVRSKSIHYENLHNEL